MILDVIDLDELNIGKWWEGIFGVIYWWMVKFGFVIVGGLSGVILFIVGFQEGILGIDQFEAIIGLWIFFFGLFIVGILIVMWVMCDYDVMEEKVLEVCVVIDCKKMVKGSFFVYMFGKLFMFKENLYFNGVIGINFVG